MSTATASTLPANQNTAEITPLTKAQLLTLGDLSLYEFLREIVRWADGGEIFERDGMLLTVAADPFPALSCAVRIASPRELPASAFIEGAARYYASLGRGFSIRARAHIDADLVAECQARGFFALGNAPGMVLRAPLAEPSSLDCELRVANDLETAADFVSVVARGYATIGLPEAACTKLMERIERLLAPHLHLVVAYREDKPVSAAMALLSHGIGGVYWVATLPEARGLGTAAHCTRAVSNYCFAQGARTVILQASPQGEPIYRALGFEQTTHYPFFLYMPKQA
jgi:GNAT superfamily N-acetyltransferase